MKKYIHISNDIKNKIIDGTYQSNEKLPSEKEFGELYDASKMTVKQALDILVTEGMIIKRRGAGTFVKDLSSGELERISINSQFRGKTAEHPREAVTSKVLEFSVVPCDELVQQKLNLDEQEFVYFVHRVRYVNGEAHTVEESFMPINLITNLKLNDVQKSIYSYIQETLNLSIQSVHRFITVRKGNELEIKELNLEEGDPVAVVEQVGYLSTGQAFEYSTSVHRYDFFKTEMVITKIDDIKKPLDKF